MKNRDTVILLPARNTVTIADSFIQSRLVKKKILSSSAVATDITQKKSKVILSTVLDYLTTADDLNNLSVKDILRNCSLPSDTYHKALAVSKSRTVVLKRTPTERNINDYNPDIIKYWSANMDLQYVCDPYSCVAYIVAYVTKDKKEMSQMLKNAASEMRNFDVKTRLKHKGHVCLTKREISAQEDAYRILGLPLKRCNTKIVWKPTHFKETRISILKSKSILETLEDESTDICCRALFISM